MLNLSLALTQYSSTGERALQDALDEAARHGVITVAAAGNQGTLGAIALVWLEFPEATAAKVRFAVTQAYAPRRTTVVPLY